MDEIRRVLNEVRANAVVFDAALKHLNTTMQANHADAKGAIAETRQALDETRQALDETRRGLDETRQALDEVAASVGRLAGKQDANAMALGETMAEVLVASSAYKSSLDSATDVMERQFSAMQAAMVDIADLKARVAALERKAG